MFLICSQAQKSMSEPTQKPPETDVDAAIALCDGDASSRCVLPKNQNTGRKPGRLIGDLSKRKGTRASAAHSPFLLPAAENIVSVQVQVFNRDIPHRRIQAWKRRKVRRSIWIEKRLGMPDVWQAVATDTAEF